MPDPVYLLEIELTSGSWTDITAYCKHVNISRQSASAESGLSVGQAQFVLMNNDGRFSPDNASGPYYPNLKINKAIRIKATYSSVNYWLFTGYIDAYGIDPTPGNKTCFLKASDRLKLLQYRSITLAIKIDINVGTLFADVLQEAGVTSGQRAIDTFTDAIPFAWFRDRRPIEVLNDLMIYGNYRIYVGPDGIVNIKNRYWGISGAMAAVYAEFENIDYNLNDDDVYNYLKVSGSPRKKAAAVAVVANLEGAPSIDPSATLIFWMNYYDPDTKDSDVPATEMVTPVATTDYTANTAADGSGTDKTAQISIAMTFFGASAKAQITNNDAGVVFITKFQLRGKSIQEQSLISYVTEDSTSQTAYGVRDYMLESDYIGSLDYAKNYGDFLTAVKKDPSPKMSMSLKNLWPDVLSRELGDVIGIQEDNIGIDNRWIIREMEHDITMSEGLEHSMTMPLDRWNSYEHAGFILDTDLLGTGTLGF